MGKSLADGAVAPTPSIAIVWADGVEQSFDGPEEFVAGHPPEQLRGFRRLAATARSDGCEVTFELNRKQRWWRSDGEALLRITGAEPEAARERMAQLLPVAGSGYQDFWGPCSIPDGLAPGNTHRYLHLVRVGLNCLVAAILGAGLYLATAQFEVPALAFGALLIGAAVPTAIDRVVPEIDVAPGGRTRFRAVLGWLSLAAFTPVGAWFVSLFTG
ncbi:MAG: hypothetical protein WA687_11835 [Solirubrobacterales bacterium]